MRLREAFFCWLAGAVIALGLAVLAALLDLPDDAALDAATQASVQDSIDRAEALEQARVQALQMAAVDKEDARALRLRMEHLQALAESLP